jgi:hypothetical protein
MKLAILLTAIALSFIVQCANAQTETQIPRSMAGDKGKYYLLDARESGGITTTLHKRVGVSETGFSMTEINCKTYQYRDMGYSENGIDKIKIKVGRWTELVTGSSKSDLVNFICFKK